VLTVGGPLLETLVMGQFFVVTIMSSVDGLVSLTGRLLMLT
jgi:hypothetical protein